MGSCSLMGQSLFFSRNLDYMERRGLTRTRTILLTVRYVSFHLNQHILTLLSRSSVKEPLMYAIFFAEFIVNKHLTITTQTYVLTYLPPLVMIYCCPYRGHDNWPLNLIVKCETAPKGEQLCKYQPRSDFMFLKS